MKYLINHAEDLVEIAVNKGFAATKFLTPIEASEIIHTFSKRKDVSIVEEGGLKGAERVRLVFLNSGWGEYGREDVITLLRIGYRIQDRIGHRDVLGAIMNLGVKRETIGDILIHSPHAFLFCLPEIAKYLIENLTKIGRVGVVVNQIPLDQLPDKQDDVNVKTITVSSNRLDNVVSGVFNVSRSKASKLIVQGQVRVGYTECLKQDKEIDENTIISVRGFGRVKLITIEGRTRKDRMRIKVGIYSI